jgi:DNA (cytosine-5)-methyltransferase 1
MVLKSIDLFSGVGGMTLALHGITTPVLYCDVDPVARASIANNISRGKLPRAPIDHDITLLKDPPLADIIVSGVPCRGWSSLGKREGLKQAESGLFYSMLKVIDASKANAVFIENVPGIVRSIGDIVAELAVKRGFQLRWTVVKASDLGAPHVRARWFCLGVKKGSKLASMNIQSLKGYTPYSWDSKSAPPRTCGKTKVSREMQARIDARSGLMGNSVVPDAVRLAFLRLFSAGSYSDLNVSTKLSFVASPEKSASESDIAMIEAGQRKTTYVVGVNKIISKRPSCKITLDPSLVTPPKNRSPMQTTETLKKPVTYSIWSTPRHGMQRSCRVLTDRSSKDLPTQIRFEKSTKMRMTPMSAVFQEWMMGYPIGFTDVHGDKV